MPTLMDVDRAAARLLDAYPGGLHVFRKQRDKPHLLYSRTILVLPGPLPLLKDIQDAAHGRGGIYPPDAKRGFTMDAYITEDTTCQTLAAAMLPHLTNPLAIVRAGLVGVHVTTLKSHHARTRGYAGFGCPEPELRRSVLDSFASLKLHEDLRLVTPMQAAMLAKRWPPFAAHYANLGATTGAGEQPSSTPAEVLAP